MKIGVSTYKAFSIFWTILCTLEVVLLIALSIAITELEFWHMVALYLIAFVVMFNLLLFHVNLYYPSTTSRGVSKVFFGLSFIAVGLITYFYAIIENGEFATTANFILLALHVLVFWKADKYYQLREDKRRDANTSPKANEDVGNFDESKAATTPLDGTLN